MASPTDVVTGLTGRLRRRWARRGLGTDDLLGTSLWPSLMENGIDAVVVRDRTGDIVAANQPAAELTGYAVAQLMTTRDRSVEAFDPRDRPEVERHLGLALSGTASTGVLRLHRRDGEVRHVQVTFVPVTHAGRVVGLVEVSRDITPHVAASRAQRELAGIVEAADVIIVSLSGRGTVRTWNRGAERTLGYRSAEMVGRHIEVLFPAGERHRYRDLAQAVAAGGSVTREVVWVRRDGTRIEVRLTASPVRDRRGRIVGGAVVGVDVTDRREALRRLRASEARFHRIAERAQGMVYRVALQPEVAIEYLNETAEEVCGYPPDVLKRHPEILGDGIRPGDRGALALIEAGVREPGIATFRFQRADGRWVDLEDHFDPILGDDGGVVGLQGIVFDVSVREEARRRLEAALEREQAAAERLQATTEMQAAFLSAVSHELRTPLTSVVGFAHTLQRHGDELPGGTRRRVTERLLTSARRLERLLDDLLDANRLSAQVMELDAEPVDLADVCRSVLDHAELGDREVATDLETVVLPADRGKVERIVDNLLRNVVRHTPARTPVWIATCPTLDGGRIVVEDAGPGIPDHLKDTVFELFRQGDRAMRSASPGTGVGLNLVAKLAELHGGRVWVEDRDGGGSRFVVELPAEREPSATAADDAATDRS